MSEKETLEDLYFTNDVYGVAEECYAKSAAELPTGTLLLTFPAPAEAPTAAAIRPATRSAPTAEVPTFSGKFRYWLEFKDLFEATVIKK